MNTDGRPESGDAAETLTPTSAPESARTWLVPWQGALAGAAAALVFVALCWAVLAAGTWSAVGTAARSFGSFNGLPVTDSRDILFSVAAQLAAMSFFATPDATFTAPIVGKYSLTVFAVPVVLTVLALSLMALGGYVVARFAPPPTWRARAAQAGAAGLGLALVTTILAASLPAELSMGTVARVVFSGAGPVPFFAALVLGAMSAWWGSGLRRGTARLPQLPLPARSARAAVVPAVWALAAHVVVFIAVVTPIVWIAAGVKGGWSVTLSAPAWVGHALAGAFTVGHFGGISVGNSVGSARTDTVQYFLAGNGDAVPVWAAWLLVLLALVASVVAASVLAIARRGRVPGPSQWWVVPTAYGVVGAVGTGVFSVWAKSGGIGYLGSGFGQAGVGAAWWFAGIFLVWGIGVEAASRFVAPYVLGALPPRWRQRVSALAMSGSEAIAPAGGAPEAPFAPESDGAPSSVVLTTNDGGATPLASGEPTPGTPVMRQLGAGARKRVLLVLGSVAAAVVLVVGGAIVLSVLKAAKGPDAPVRAYLDDIVAGRVQSALEKVSPNLPTESRSLLTDEIYSKASSRIDRYSVVRTDTNADSATVVVDVGQDGRNQRQTFTVSKRHPGLFDDNWTVDSGSLVQPVTVSVNTKNAKLAVNGVSAAAAASKPLYGGLSSGSGKATGPDGWLTDGRTEHTFYALPGKYSAKLDTDSPLLSAPDTSFTVAVGAQAPTGAQLVAAPTQAFKDQLDASVKALLDKCVARTSFPASSSTVRSECPFDKSNYGSYDYRNIQWKLLQAPTYQLGDLVYSDGAVKVSGKGPGVAQVTFQSKYVSTFTADDPYRDDKSSVTFSLDGAAVIKDGKVEFQYSEWGYYKPASGGI